MAVLQTTLWTARFARLRQWLLATFTFSEPEVLFGGSVLSAAGEPIAFASVTLKGTRYESATNAAGHFLLHVPLRLCNGPLCLRVSARGYATLEEVVGGAPQPDLQFTLREAESARVIPFGRKPVRKTS
ncbi:carboxypeptidase regulatory-like domain-containing protein [Flaviaesturariibacter flavus]|nr:carboxypeptidase-like regulatory domain-containing protein [Flaviaesturariibacter flavus]